MQKQATSLTRLGTRQPPVRPLVGRPLQPALPGLPQQIPGTAMKIRLADYPQLQLIAWSHRPDDTVDEHEALSLYERNWHHVDHAHLSDHERRLIEHLVHTVGNGVLNV